jgi:hypothetical protein
MGSSSRTFDIQRAVDPTLDTLKKGFSVGQGAGTEPGAGTRVAEEKGKELTSKGRHSYKERKRRGLSADQAWIREAEGYKEADDYEKTSAHKKVKRKSKLRRSRNPSGQQFKDTRHSVGSPGSNSKNMLVKRAAKSFTSGFILGLVKQAVSDDPNDFYADDGFVSDHIRSGRTDTLFTKTHPPSVKKKKPSKGVA